MDAQRRGKGREHGKESEMGGESKERCDSDTRQEKAAMADRELVKDDDFGFKVTPRRQLRGRGWGGRETSKTTSRPGRARSARIQRHRLPVFE